MVEPREYVNIFFIFCLSYSLIVKYEFFKLQNSEWALLLYTEDLQRKKVVFAFEVIMMERTGKSELTHSDINARIEVYLGC